jgi:hypothetical protein
MPGSATYDPSAVGLDGSAWALITALYEREEGGFSILPNVQVRRIRKTLGAVPASAQFSYVTDSSDPNSPFPRWPEQLWPLGAGGSSAYAAATGDEIVVFAQDENGAVEVLFDGFVEAPQVDIMGQGQAITFVARGVAIRCWDQPTGGMILRNADEAFQSDGSADVQTDLIARFNPVAGEFWDAQPNATPEGADAGDAPLQYPVFLDWRIVRSPDPRRAWTLGMLARYLLGQRADDEQTYVDNPPSEILSQIDEMLQAIVPQGAGLDGPIDVTDPSTYTLQDIEVDDLVGSERPWPEVLQKAISPYGMHLVFTTGREDLGGQLPIPTNTIGFVRRDGLFGLPPKLLHLQAGDTLDPGRSNIEGLRLVRDTTNVKNAVEIKAGPDRYEVSLVLAPGFPISPEDAASASSIKSFDFTDPSFDKLNSDKYRLYVFDETGDGHWDWSTHGMTSGLATDLSTVFEPGNEGGPTFAARRRPPIRQLVSTDPNGIPLDARLAISQDYNGDVPGVWDGTGTWQKIAGGFALCPDRIGILINTPNPNGWNIGSPTASGMPYPAGVVRGVEEQANEGAKHFHLRLTCVIEADQDLDATAERRTSSPVPFEVWSAQDYRDLYRRDYIHASSEYNETEDTYNVRDDTGFAQAQARAIRREQETPPVQATAEIPWLSLAYELGDRIAGIDGRGIDLSGSSGAEAGETPAYPMVTAVEWDFTNGQRTRLELGDPGGE